MLMLLAAGSGIAFGVYPIFRDEWLEGDDVLKMDEYVKDDAIVGVEPERVITMAAAVVVEQIDTIHVGVDPRLPTPHLPTRSAKPTGWYVVPANPTPRPTPILAAAESLASVCDGPGSMNILFIGVDGRGSAEVRTGRADSLIVAGFQFGTHSAQVVSIPRDLWVKIPEYGENQASEGRVNTAYDLGRRFEYPGGGPGFQMHVIEQALGIRLDRYVVVNFGAFEAIVDTIGGVDVFLDSGMLDTRYPMGVDNTMVLKFPAGSVHMDGATALMYARSRYADSDFGRMRRQQKVLMAVREKMTSPGVMFHLPAVLWYMLEHVSTDLSWREIGILGCAIPMMEDEDITRIVIDQSMTSPAITSGGGSVLVPDMDKIIMSLGVLSVDE